MRTHFRPLRAAAQTGGATRTGRAWLAIVLALIALVACLSAGGRIADALLGSAR